MDFWIGTTNIGKLREFERLLADLPLKIRSIKELTSYTQPPETGKTFLENARIKAKSIHAVRPESWVLAEDSGLEVPGLGGLPGVHSARYAGNNASDMENTAKLIKMLNLKSVVDRSACFKCQIVVYAPTGKEYLFQGEMNGTIASPPRGTDGFGYDPVFVPQGETKTFAELGIAMKNKYSHRARAVESMLAVLGDEWRSL